MSPLSYRRHVPAPTAPTVVSGTNLSIKVTAAYGRMYVGGPNYRIALALPGAVINERRGMIELTLTLDMLRLLRKTTGLDSQSFARFCSPEILAWAKAAGKMEAQVRDMHAKLDEGFRIEFPWADRRTGLPAQENATDKETEYNWTTGQRVYKYRAPFEHQKIMATGSMMLDGIAYLCEMGTAKSRAGAEVINAKLASGEVDVGIVVCPRGVIGTWKREFAQWTDGIRTVALIDMPVVERAKILAAFRPGTGKTVFIVNYDVLDKLKSTLQTMATRFRVFLLCDEMHKIRNPHAKMSKAILTLTPMMKWRLGLTGSPILQGGHDIWSQYYFIDMGVTFGANFVQFKREFFTEDPWTMKTLPKPGALDEIGRRLRLRGFRYRKEDCLDLPPKIYETVEVELTNEQWKAYHDMEEELVAFLSGQAPADWQDIEPSELEGAGLSTAATQLAAMLRLTQITSGFVPMDGGGIHNFEPNPKLNALEDLVRENIGSQQILVWARYRHDHDQIMHRLRDLNPQLIRGGVNQKERDRIELGFQNGDYRLIVGQPGAGGIGLNLQMASLAIYYSQSYSLEHRAQSEDRSHRSGSERHDRVTYIDLIASGTIDTAVSQALQDKKDVASVVTDLKRIIGINA